ncbi:DUF6174 domain-containing protein [Streptomyces calidiresistens]|uniref:Lipoprotein n=1 Tax=Streptomyces calidiresistens TaxID=1485586 RepID=A0A7W3SZX1_9ACTN|nr:DUF6174 domain-containing protein [Streptomyces calidiresistens]MBB0228333.1 hypothetical protein [Streptomyces calidiresistens]
MTGALCGAVGLTMTLAGCGTESAAGGDAWREWREPANYTYTLHSTCGERGGHGWFRVTVVDREADMVVAMSERDGEDTGEELPLEHWREDPLTIGEVLARARTAEEEWEADSVEVEMAEDGRPTSVEIDIYREAIDDELCYYLYDFTR